MYACMLQVCSVCNACNENVMQCNVMLCYAMYVCMDRHIYIYTPTYTFALHTNVCVCMPTHVVYVHACDITQTKTTQHMKHRTSCYINIFYIWIDLYTYVKT